MPILKYTTQIEASKTIGEIQEMLARAGAMSISVNYISGHPVSVSFSAEIAGPGSARAYFRLPASIDGAYEIMWHDDSIPKKLKNRNQAERVAWRIVRAWVEAQIAFVEAGQATIPQLFLPHALENRDSQRTLYDSFVESAQLRLTDGDYDETV